MENLELWWENSTAYTTFDEFHAYYDKYACCTWNNVDIRGNYINDSKYTRIENCYALYAINAPKLFILKIATFVACENREECVAYVRNVCDWYRKKRNE